MQQIDCSLLDDLQAEDRSIDVAKVCANSIPCLCDDDMFQSSMKESRSLLKSTTKTSLGSFEEAGAWVKTPKEHPFISSAITCLNVLEARLRSRAQDLFVDELSVKRSSSLGP